MNTYFGGYDPTNGINDIVNSDDFSDWHTLTCFAQFVLNIKNITRGTKKRSFAAQIRF